MTKIVACVTLSLSALCFILSCDASEAPEDFSSFFERAKTDQPFKLERVAKDFRVYEELTWDEPVQRKTRRVPCSYAEIEKHGWAVLPDKTRLEATGAAYGAPQRRGKRLVVITLGPLDGGADAEYRFERRNGKWFHASMLVFSSVPTGQAAPPVPCGLHGR